MIAVVDLFDSEVYDSLLGASLLLVGLMISATSYGQWRRREEAIRRAAALPCSPIPLLATVAVTVIGSVILIVALVP